MNYGIVGSAGGGGGHNYAIYGALSVSFSNNPGDVGVWGDAVNTAGGYGIYGTSGSSTGYAGYFNNTGGGYAAAFMGGNVGIDVSNPVNTLQIGSMGSIGYAGNALAIGNGTNAIAINPGAMGYVAANGSLALGGNNNVTNQLILAASGNVGIGNSAPAYLLHVGSSGASGAVAVFQNSSGYCTFTPVTNFISCSSDMRLKKDIRDSELGS